MKASVLRDMTEDELLHQRDETRKRLFDLRIRKGMGDTSDQPLLLRTVRRDAARVETIAKERGLLK